MQHTRQFIPLDHTPRSLNWRGDGLVDWVDGQRVISLAKGDLGTNRRFAYRFDAAAQSSSGRFAAVYERMGTKAVLLDHGKEIRELNRSYYHADRYEYPIAFVSDSSGRELIAHCPESYNRVDLEVAETGERLTGGCLRHLDDVFYSRLAVSPDLRRLLSAGWIWHPVDVVHLWDIADVLSDPTGLDKHAPPGFAKLCEINDAAFIDQDRVVLASNPDALESTMNRSLMKPGSLGIYNLVSSSFEQISPIEEPMGDMMWLDSEHILGFHGSPKIVHIPTGRIIQRWPDLPTGKCSGSIQRSDVHRFPRALDPANRRFAVGVETGVVIIQFS